MCWRPSPTGAVYPKFDQGNVSSEALWRPGLRTIGAADYGFANDPAAGNLFCRDGNLWSCFLEYHELNMPAEDQARAYFELSKRYDVETWYVDGSAAELIRYMRRLGLTVVAIKRKLSGGIDKVSSLLLNGMGVRTLRFHPSLKFTLREMRAYELSDTTKKPRLNQEDHHCDCVRYFAEGVGKKTRAGSRSRSASPIGSSLSARSSGLERIK